MTSDSTYLSQLKLSLLVTTLLTISACSTITPMPEQQPRAVPPVVEPTITSVESQPKVATPAPAPVPVAPKSLPKTQQSDAVIALLNTASQQQQLGDYRSAQTTLQRAQRIAPQEPDVYYELAATHRDLEDYALAEQVALKGISIVQGQSSQLKRFWSLLAEIYTLAGDDSAAKTAQIKAASY